MRTLRLITVPLLMLVASACLQPAHQGAAKFSSLEPDLISVEGFGLATIKYCGDCHRTGQFSFVDTDDDPEKTASNVFTKESALYEKSLAESMVEVLSWPTDDPPSNGTRLDPKRRFMPIGRMKYSFATDKHQDVLTRIAIIKFIKKNLRDIEPSN